MHLIRRARCNLRLFLLFITPSRPLAFPSLAGSTIHGLENNSSSNDTQQGRKPPVNTNSLIRKLSPKSNGCDDGDGDGEDETTPVKKSLASAKCAGPRVRLQFLLKWKLLKHQRKTQRTRDVDFHMLKGRWPLYSPHSSWNNLHVKLNLVWICRISYDHRPTMNIHV